MWCILYMCVYRSDPLKPFEVGLNTQIDSCQISCQMTWYLSSPRKLTSSTLSSACHRDTGQDNTDILKVWLQQWSTKKAPGMVPSTRRRTKKSLESKLPMLLPHAASINSKLQPTHSREVLGSVCSCWCVVLGMRPGAWHVLDKHSTTEIDLGSEFFFFNYRKLTWY